MVGMLVLNSTSFSLQIKKIKKMGQSQSSVFVLKNDESLVIPVSFTKELVEKLEKRDQSGAEGPKTTKLQEIKKLVYEEKSSKDLQSEIDEMLKRQQNLPILKDSSKVAEIDFKLKECYKTRKSLDCYQLVADLHEMEKNALLNAA